MGRPRSLGRDPELVEQRRRAHDLAQEAMRKAMQEKDEDLELLLWGAGLGPKPERKEDG